jgi:hypothetical protein
VYGLRVRHINTGHLHEMLTCVHCFMHHVCFSLSIQNLSDEQKNCHCHVNNGTLRGISPVCLVYTKCVFVMYHSHDHCKNCNNHVNNGMFRGNFVHTKNVLSMQPEYLSCEFCIHHVLFV